MHELAHFFVNPLIKLKNVPLKIQPSLHSLVGGLTYINILCLLSNAAYVFNKPQFNKNKISNRVLGVLEYSTYLG